MNINLRLTSEYADVLQKHIAATGEDLDMFVSHLVADSLQAEVESARVRRQKQETFGEWLKQWANRHPRLEQDIDISRDSIYAGCGE